MHLYLKRILCLCLLLSVDITILQATDTWAQICGDRVVGGVESCDAVMMEILTMRTAARHPAQLKWATCVSGHIAMMPTHVAHRACGFVTPTQVCNFSTLQMMLKRVLEASNATSPCKHGTALHGTRRMQT
jgi:hypothetical protein